MRCGNKTFCFTFVKKAKMDEIHVRKASSLLNNGAFGEVHYCVHWALEANLFNLLKICIPAVVLQISRTYSITDHLIKTLFNISSKKTTFFTQQKLHFPLCLPKPWPW